MAGRDPINDSKTETGPTVVTSTGLVEPGESFQDTLAVLLRYTSATTPGAVGMFVRYSPPRA